MAFRKLWRLVLEASSFLVFTLWSSIVFSFGLFYSLLVVTGCRSRGAQILDLPPYSLQPIKGLRGSIKKMGFLLQK